MSEVNEVWMADLVKTNTNCNGDVYTVNAIIGEYAIPYTVVVNATNAMLCFTKTIVTAAICEERALLDHAHVQHFKTYFRDEFADMIHSMVSYGVGQMIERGFERYRCTMC